MIFKFPFYFNIFISKALSFFLIILIRYLNKNNINRSPTMRRYHLDVNNTKRKIKTGLFVILISILEIIFKLEGYITYGKPNYIELKLGFILFVPLLSKFILKKELFKHHIFSFFISVIGFIFIILSLLFIDKDYKPVLNDQIKHFFFSFPLSLSFVLIKYIYEKSFLNAYEFLFYDGLLCIILPFVLVAVETIFKGSDYFINNISGISILFYDFKSIFFFFSILFFSFSYYLTNSLTLYFFTPMLLVMTDILSPFFRWIIELISLSTYENKDVNPEFEEKYKENGCNNMIYVIILKILGFLIIIFTALVFNEIIVLKFYNFDKNIKKNIQNRGDDELINKGNLDLSIISKDESINIIDCSVESEMSEI